jgi:Ca2+-binding EF-hand superfamily protein
MFSRIAFRAFDKDKSGTITFSEFLLATAFVNHGDGQDGLQDSLDMAFDIYDYDDNKKIDREEMEQMISAIYELEGYQFVDIQRRVDEIFNTYDGMGGKKGNKSLDKKEFVQFMKTDPVIITHFGY